MGCIGGCGGGSGGSRTSQTTKQKYLEKNNNATFVVAGGMEIKIDKEKVKAIRLNG